ncbi:mannose-binding protein-like isoform X2 [Heptranchias perlo]|uniref:mannose-binding protein-like isoform X2 n=1 Tax=Heptranchias perlo TaxID=212740 RepID=UPI003559C0BC
MLEALSLCGEKKGFPGVQGPKANDGRPGKVGPAGQKGEKGDKGYEGPICNTSQMADLEAKLQLLQDNLSQLRKAFSFNAGIQDVEGKLFVASIGKTNFENAKRMCREAGGELVSPRNSAENKAIYDIVREMGKSVFLGIKATQTERLFKYPNGDEIIYSNWDSGEPNNVNNNEDCVEFKSNQMWNDVSCDYQFSIVCEFV